MGACLSLDTPLRNKFYRQMLTAWVGVPKLRVVGMRTGLTHKCICASWVTMRNFIRWRIIYTAGNIGTLCHVLRMSLEVSGTETDGSDPVCLHVSGPYSYSRPIIVHSYGFPDKRRFRTKDAYLSSHSVYALLIGYSLEFCNAGWVQKPE